VRHLRGHDPAGSPRARRPARPAGVRGARHRRAPQRLRPPGRFVRGTARRGRRERRSGRRRVHPGPVRGTGRPGRGGAGVGRRAPRRGPPGPAAGRCLSPRAVVGLAHTPTVPGRLVGMSGHSKWATIKHKKGAQDKARGKLFAKLIRQVEVAAREGGGDPNSNATLRTMFTKARDASVPMDTIERAIKRGTGELEGVRYESVNYEGYAPNGVAVIVECLTDNRNRTGADIRSVFTRNGGSMAEPGAVSWQFERKGVILVPRSVSEDDLMLTALDAG